MCPRCFVILNKQVSRYMYGAYHTWMSNSTCKQILNLVKLARVCIKLSSILVFFRLEVKHFPKRNVSLVARVYKFAVMFNQNRNVKYNASWMESPVLSVLYKPIRKHVEDYELWQVARLNFSSFPIKLKLSVGV